MKNKNHELELFLNEKKISERVVQIATQLNEDFQGKKPAILSVLSGSFIFTSDLIRSINFEHTLTFTKIRSYHGMSSTNQFDFQLDLKELNEREDLIIVEDIVDTGNTLDFLINKLADKKPESISVVSLLLKRQVYKYEHKIHYVGFEIPDNFVVGYGMDLNHKYRNLRDIYIYNQNK